jgi:hypothetical protein
VLLCVFFGGFGTDRFLIEHNIDEAGAIDSSVVETSEVKPVVAERVVRAQEKVAVAVVEKAHTRIARTVLARPEGEQQKLAPASVAEVELEPTAAHLQAIAKRYPKGDAKRKDTAHLTMEYKRRLALTKQYDADKGKDCSRCIPKYAPFLALLSPFLTLTCPCSSSPPPDTQRAVWMHALNSDARMGSVNTTRVRIASNVVSAQRR